MNIEQELSRLSIGLISEPKVAVTRTMMAQVLAFIQGQAAEIKALKAAAVERKPCNACEQTPAYQIPVERETPAYAALRQAGIDRIIERDEAVAAGGR